MYEARLSNVVPPSVITLPLAGSGNFPQSTVKGLTCSEQVYVFPNENICTEAINGHTKMFCV